MANQRKRTPEERAAHARQVGRKGGRPRAGTRSAALEYFRKIPNAKVEAIVNNLIESAIRGDRDAMKMVAPVLVPTSPQVVVNLSAFDLKSVRGILDAKEHVVRLGASDKIPPEKQRQVMEGLSSLEASIDGGKLEAEIEELTAKLEAIGIEGLVGRQTVVPLRPIKAEA